MNTYQIASKVLQDYKNHQLSDERIDFLKQQAKKQLNEIFQNTEIYESFLDTSKAPKNADFIILWIFFMSDEEIVYQYIKKFNKDFTDIIPVSDLADLLIYLIYQTKNENALIDGFDFLIDFESEGISEVDNYAFTNMLLYIQKLKEAPMEF